MRNARSLCAAVLALGALAGRAGAAPLQVEERGWAATPVRGSGEIEALAQTPDGLLWLGDRHGLRRYDGFRLEQLTDPALTGAQRFVRRLFVEAGLWVATGEGQLALATPTEGGLVDWRGTAAGFYRLDQGRLERPWFADRLPSPWVWALAQGPDTLWIGTEGGLVRVRQGAVRVFTAADGLPHAFVTALRADGDTLWVGTAAGLARLRADRAETVIAERPVFSVVLRGPGLPVVATNRGVFEVREGTPVELLGARAENLVVTRDGELWGTTWGRLWRHHSTNQGEVVMVKGLDRIAALLEDQERSVWAASRLHGLVQLRATPIEPVPAVLDETPFSVLAGRGGELWVATTKRALALRDREVVRSDARGPRLPTPVARFLAQTADGRVWITARESGLMELTADGWRPHRFERAGRSRTVEGALGTRDGALWVGWLDGGLSRFSGANLEGPATEVGTADGLCPGRFGPMMEARDGALWAGSHDGGVAVMRDGRWQCLGTGAGLPSERVAALHEDGGGDVHVGSLDSVGLAVIRGRAVRAVIDEAERGPGRVFGMTEDRRGGFWITSDRGVAMVPKSLLAARVEGRRGPLPWRHFDVADGLPSDTCMSWFGPSVAQTPDGLIWVPTLGGLAVIDPSRLPPPVAAHVLVDQIKAAGQPVVGTSISLDPDRADLEVRYTAPTFLASSAVSFEHRLIGFDRGWVAAGDRRDVHYASLPSGHYQLAIRALDSTAHPMGEPALLAVEVRRRFWQRPAVVGLALAALTLSLLLGYRLRMRQVEARYAAVQEDRGRIARDLHDGLAQGLMSVGLHLDALKVSLPDPANPMREVLVRARAILDRVQSEARLAIWNLRAQSASRVSVADALARVVNQAMLDGAAVHVTFRAEGPELARSGGTAALEHELPHIVQEAITNAVRHGAATHIRVVLHAEPGCVVLTIADDGTGFDPEAPTVRPGGLGGFGIVGMQERAQRLGGKLEIRRAPEGGMEVAVSVPRSERSPQR